MESHASEDFWVLYRKLPPSIQQAADKQFALFLRDPGHPSLHLKRVGEFWSVRITGSYRALALREKGVFYWFWVGDHREYERLIG